jgi:hypothetical protein
VPLCHMKQCPLRRINYAALPDLPFLSLSQEM